MVGGLIQLIARSSQDIFLTGNPSITLFKTVYRRYGDFAMEDIPINFRGRVGFGRTLEATIPHCGDLLQSLLLFLKLPRVWAKHTKTISEAITELYKQQGIENYCVDSTNKMLNKLDFLSNWLNSEQSQFADVINKFLIINGDVDQSDSLENQVSINNYQVDNSEYFEFNDSTVSIEDSQIGLMVANIDEYLSNTSSFFEVINDDDPSSVGDVIIDYKNPTWDDWSSVEDMHDKIYNVLVSQDCYSEIVRYLIWYKNEFHRLNPELGGDLQLKTIFTVILDLYEFFFNNLIGSQQDKRVAQIYHIETAFTDDTEWISNLTSGDIVYLYKSYDPSEYSYETTTKYKLKVTHVETSGTINSTDGVVVVLLEYQSVTSNDEYDELATLLASDYIKISDSINFGVIKTIYNTMLIFHQLTTDTWERPSVVNDLMDLWNNTNDSAILELVQTDDTVENVDSIALPIDVIREYIPNATENIVVGNIVRQKRNKRTIQDTTVYYLELLGDVSRDVCTNFTLENLFRPNYSVNLNYGSENDDVLDYIEWSDHTYIKDVNFEITKIMLEINIGQYAGQWNALPQDGDTYSLVLSSEGVGPYSLEGTVVKVVFQQTKTLVYMDVLWGANVKVETSDPIINMNNGTNLINYTYDSENPLVTLYYRLVNYELTFDASQMTETSPVVNDYMSVYSVLNLSPNNIDQTNNLMYFGRIVDLTETSTEIVVTTEKYYGVYNQELRVNDYLQFFYRSSTTLVAPSSALLMQVKSIDFSDPDDMSPSDDLETKRKYGKTIIELEYVSGTETLFDTFPTTAGSTLTCQRLLNQNLSINGRLYHTMLLDSKIDSIDDFGVVMSVNSTMNLIRTEDSSEVVIGQVVLKSIIDSNTGRSIIEFTYEPYTTYSMYDVANEITLLNANKVSNITYKLQNNRDFSEILRIERYNILIDGPSIVRGSTPIWLNPLYTSGTSGAGLNKNRIYLVPFDDIGENNLYGEVSVASYNTTLQRNTLTLIDSSGNNLDFSDVNDTYLVRRDLQISEVIDIPRYIITVNNANLTNSSTWVNSLSVNKYFRMNDTYLRVEAINMSGLNTVINAVYDTTRPDFNTLGDVNSTTETFVSNGNRTNIATTSTINNIDNLLNAQLSRIKTRTQLHLVLGETNYVVSPAGDIRYFFFWQRPYIYDYPTYSSTYFLRSNVSGNNTSIATYISSSDGIDDVIGQRYAAYLKTKRIVTNIYGTFNATNNFIYQGTADINGDLTPDTTPVAEHCIYFGNDTGSAQLVPNQRYHEYLGGSIGIPPPPRTFVFSFANMPMYDASGVLVPTAFDSSGNPVLKSTTYTFRIVQITAEPISGINYRLVLHAYIMYNGPPDDAYSIFEGYSFTVPCINSLGGVYNATATILEVDGSPYTKLNYTLTPPDSQRVVNFEVDNIVRRDNLIHLVGTITTDPLNAGVHDVPYDLTSTVVTFQRYTQVGVVSTVGTAQILGHNTHSVEYLYGQLSIIGGYESLPVSGTPYVLLFNQAPYIAKYPTDAPDPPTASTIPTTGVTLRTRYRAYLNDHFPSVMLKCTDGTGTKVGDLEILEFNNIGNTIFIQYRYLPFVGGSTIVSQQFSEYTTFYNAVSSTKVNIPRFDMTLQLTPTVEYKASAYDPNRNFTLTSNSEVRISVNNDVTGWYYGLTSGVPNLVFQNGQIMYGYNSYDYSSRFTVSGTAIYDSSSNTTTIGTLFNAIFNVNSPASPANSFYDMYFNLSGSGMISLYPQAFTPSSIRTQLQITNTGWTGDKLITNLSGSNLITLYKTADPNNVAINDATIHARVQTLNTSGSFYFLDVTQHAFVDTGNTTYTLLDVEPGDYMSNKLDHAQITTFFPNLIVLADNISNVSVWQTPASVGSILVIGEDDDMSDATPPVEIDETNHVVTSISSFNELDSSGNIVRRTRLGISTVGVSNSNAVSAATIVAGNFIMTRVDETFVTNVYQLEGIQFNSINLEEPSTHTRWDRQIAPCDELCIHSVNSGVLRQLALFNVYNLEASTELVGTTTVNRTYLWISIDSGDLNDIITRNFVADLYDQSQIGYTLRQQLQLSNTYEQIDVETNITQTMTLIDEGYEEDDRILSYKSSDVDDDMIHGQQQNTFVIESVGSNTITVSQDMTRVLNVTLDLAEFYNSTDYYFFRQNEYPNDVVHDINIQYAYYLRQNSPITVTLSDGSSPATTYNMVVYDIYSMSGSVHIVGHIPEPYNIDYFELDLTAFMASIPVYDLTDPSDNVPSFVDVNILDNVYSVIYNQYLQDTNILLNNYGQAVITELDNYRAVINRNALTTTFGHNFPDWKPHVQLNDVLNIYNVNDIRDTSIQLQINTVGTDYDRVNHETDIQIEAITGDLDTDLQEGQIIIRENENDLAASDSKVIENFIDYNNSDLSNSNNYFSSVFKHFYYYINQTKIRTDGVEQTRYKNQLLEPMYYRVLVKVDDTDDQAGLEHYLNNYCTLDDVEEREVVHTVNTGVSTIDPVYVLPHWHKFGNNFYALDVVIIVSETEMSQEIDDGMTLTINLTNVPDYTSYTSSATIETTILKTYNYNIDLNKNIDLVTYDYTRNRPKLTETTVSRMYSDVFYLEIDGNILANYGASPKRWDIANLIDVGSILYIRKNNSQVREDINYIIAKVIVTSIENTEEVDEAITVTKLFVKVLSMIDVGTDSISTNTDAKIEMIENFVYVSYTDAEITINDSQYNMTTTVIVAEPVVHDLVKVYENVSSVVNKNQITNNEYIQLIDRSQRVGFYYNTKLIRNMMRAIQPRRTINDETIINNTLPLITSVYSDYAVTTTVTNFQTVLDVSGNALFKSSVIGFSNIPLTGVVNTDYTDTSVDDPSVQPTQRHINFGRNYDQMIEFENEIIKATAVVENGYEIVQNNNAGIQLPIITNVHKMFNTYETNILSHTTDAFSDIDQVADDLIQFGAIIGAYGDSEIQPIIENIYGGTSVDIAGTDVTNNTSNAATSSAIYEINNMEDAINEQIATNTTLSRTVNYYTNYVYLDYFQYVMKTITQNKYYTGLDDLANLNDKTQYLVICRRVIREIPRVLFALMNRIRDNVVAENNTYVRFVTCHDHEYPFSYDALVKYIIDDLVYVPYYATNTTVKVDMLRIIYYISLSIRREIMENATLEEETDLYDTVFNYVASVDDIMDVENEIKQHMFDTLVYFNTEGLQSSVQLLDYRYTNVLIGLKNMNLEYGNQVIDFVNNAKRNIGLSSNDLLVECVNNDYYGVNLDTLMETITNYPKYDLVDGEIVIDRDSMMYDNLDRLVMYLNDEYIIRVSMITRFVENRNILRIKDLPINRAGYFSATSDSIKEYVFSLIRTRDTNGDLSVYKNDYSVTSENEEYINDVISDYLAANEDHFWEKYIEEWKTNFTIFYHNNQVLHVLFDLFGSCEQVQSNIEKMNHIKLIQYYAGSTPTQSQINNVISTNINPYNSAIVEDSYVLLNGCIVTSAEYDEIQPIISYIDTMTPTQLAERDEIMNYLNDGSSSPYVGLKWYIYDNFKNRNVDNLTRTHMEEYVQEMTNGNYYLQDYTIINSTEKGMLQLGQVSDTLVRTNNSWESVIQVKHKWDLPIGFIYDVNTQTLTRTFYYDATTVENNHLFTELVRIRDIVHESPNDELDTPTQTIVDNMVEDYWNVEYAIKHIDSYIPTINDTFEEYRSTFVSNTEEAADVTTILDKTKETDITMNTMIMRMKNDIKYNYAPRMVKDHTCGCKYYYDVLARVMDITNKESTITGEKERLIETVNAVSTTESNKHEIYESDEFQEMLNEIINRSDIGKIGWISDVGYHMVEYVELAADDQILERWSGAYCQLYHMANGNKSHKRGLDRMVGNYDTLTRYEAEVKENYNIWLPIEMSFFRHTGLALPLVALPHTDLKVRVKLRPLEQLVKHTVGTDIVVMDPEIKTNLLGNFIYLNEEHRKLFARSAHEYLIEQTQEIESQTINVNSSDQSSIEVKINLRNTVDFLMITTQRVTHVNNMEYSNYGYMSTSDKVSENVSNDGGGMLLKNMTLEVNGRRTMSTRDASFYNYGIVRRHFLGALPDGVHIIPFCLYPYQYQPSGSMNFSLIQDARIQLEFKETVNEQVVVKVYGIGRNVLRVMSGYCGVAFDQ